MSRMRLQIKTIQQLGWKPALLYLQYKVYAKTGLYRLAAAGRLSPLYKHTGELLPLPFRLPPKEALLEIIGDGLDGLLREADEILDGRVRLFGSDPQPLVLRPPFPLKFWTKHSAAWTGGQDIKMIWEPGRFGWAPVLVRAYYLSGKEKYAEAFWSYTEEFLAANPPHRGPHWSSAQEVALRLISLVFSYSVVSFSPHTTWARSRLLAEAIAEHAARIPATLAYAQAQNNNHLLTEAAGLYTAGAVLPNHLLAKRWRKLGWKWMNHALQRQIAADGTFIQHSANYHRLMLQTALWAAMTAGRLEEPLPPATREKLGAATRWMQHLMDPQSGQLPNLGPNDGAYILPLSVLPFADFRPVVQAAGLAFLGEKLLPAGPWDEMAAWLAPQPGIPPAKSVTGLPLKLSGSSSWGTLRASRFNARPGHADQLHFDLWWRGMNIALDAGSYSYNAPPPWQNAFSGTDVHNTVMVGSRHQMTPASRFLWLDWAQAEIIENSTQRIAARHDGYAKLGLTHTRRVELSSANSWRVADRISPGQPSGSKEHQFRLHWLLPDWPWKLDGAALRLQSPYGTIAIAIESPDELLVSLARGGELLAGEGDVPPQRGWVSPTYSEKHPALSMAALTRAAEANFTTIFKFPE